ncbi:TPA: hypothetical protein L6A42_35295, partial [Pseudomonas aeruginosa]|nr:hypothetical protein [Pseudomonas aeruginosa]
MSSRNAEGDRRKPSDRRVTRGRLRAASSFLAPEMGPFLLENEMFGNLIDSEIPAIPKAPPAPL